MRRVSVRSKGLAVVTTVLVSIGTFAGASTVGASASGCSGGLPVSGAELTQTASRCTSLSGGTQQRAYHWCPTTGWGWRYSSYTSSSGVWKYTSVCPNSVSGRNQQIT